MIGGIVLNPLLRRYVILELIFGIAVMGLGLFFGGCTLTALGACMVGLSAQCSAKTDKFPWIAVTLGMISLLALAGSGVSAFVSMVSLSRYEDSTSPLTVLLVLSVVILVQSFLALPVEDRPDLSFLRQEISRLAVFCLVGFAGIVLNYVLSYVLYDASLSAFLEGQSLSDFHFLEGVFSLAVVLTSARGVLRAFLKEKEPIRGSEGKEIPNEES